MSLFPEILIGLLILIAILAAGARLFLNIRFDRTRQYILVGLAGFLAIVYLVRFFVIL